MAVFTNFATLSYNGVTTNSNVVTGEILQSISATKTAVVPEYSADGDVTYVVSLVNSSTATVNGLSVTDDLGGYTFGTDTIYPLSLIDGSVRFYVNGVLQPAPTVSAGPPAVIGGISVPAGGNAIIIYEAAVTRFAPLAATDTIVNTVTVDGAGLASPVTAAETITAREDADLTVSKAVNPAVITENGQLTYTFAIENSGNADADATDNVILSDTFDPILTDLTVIYNGTVWTENVNYTYDETTGVFTTLPGQITVPAATYTQNADGEWVRSPGIATLSITGTV